MTVYPCRLAFMDTQWWDGRIDEWEENWNKWGGMDCKNKIREWRI